MFVHSIVLHDSVVYIESFNTKKSFVLYCDDARITVQYSFDLLDFPAKNDGHRNAIHIVLSAHLWNVIHP